MAFYPPALCTGTLRANKSRTDVSTSLASDNNQCLLAVAGRQVIAD